MAKRLTIEDMVDGRSKEQLKADGDYTPEYWRRLMEQRGWTSDHGQGKRKKQGTPRPRPSKKQEGA